MVSSSVIRCPMSAITSPLFREEEGRWRGGGGGGRQQVVCGVGSSATARINVETAMSSDILCRPHARRLSRCRAAPRPTLNQLRVTCHQALYLSSFTARRSDGVARVQTAFRARREGLRPGEMTGRVRVVAAVCAYWGCAQWSPPWRLPWLLLNDSNSIDMYTSRSQSRTHKPVTVERRCHPTSPTRGSTVR